MNHRRMDGLSTLVWTPMYATRYTRRQLERMTQRGWLEYKDVHVYDGVERRYRLKEGQCDTR